MHSHLLQLSAQMISGFQVTHCRRPLCLAWCLIPRAAPDSISLAEQQGEVTQSCPSDTLVTQDSHSPPQAPFLTTGVIQSTVLHSHHLYEEFILCYPMCFPVAITFLDNLGMQICGRFLHKSFSVTSGDLQPHSVVPGQGAIFGACVSLADDEQNGSQAGRGTQQHLAYLE